MSSPYRDKLEAKIRDEYAERGNALVNGYATTIEDYRQRAGFLEALRWCLKACEDAERELNTEE